ncbi:phospholipid-transporting ATPase IB-like [Anneissia japonica]|uniref:phospholipid-transporting ATPase IB-like n=1 Tax=Anneissia japonica TaxID=1529436 RepID=UPI001425A9E2|nr:phospholipid-transporting ATPase IB-like [Anneissia japonica]
MADFARLDGLSVQQDPCISPAAATDAVCLEVRFAEGDDKQSSNWFSSFLEEGVHIHERSSRSHDDNTSRVISFRHLHTTDFLTNRVNTGKYTYLTFVPIFLYEQFRRYANIFFLFIALLQQIPGVSPTGRYTTLVPLLFILFVSAVKEIIEDFKRHNADVEVNNRKVQVYRGQKWMKRAWQDVCVGDIVKVERDEVFPADLILLASSEPQAMCYIETANLDGETNLKIRQGLPQTAHMTNCQELYNLSGSIECQLPNRHIYEFVGNVKIKEEATTKIPLGPNQLLLRGATLKNTHWIHGVVIYTGHESKLLMNSRSAPLKQSMVDKTTNSQIFYLFFGLLTLALISAIAQQAWTNKQKFNHWYLGYQDKKPSNFFYNFLTFIILYNNLIPISLPVTLELVKFGQALFINSDIEMYHEDTDTPAQARTSNLNDELGQVKYIFSDKTGTLTCNMMQFRRCSIAGIKYGSAKDNSPVFSDPQLLQNLSEKHASSAHIRMFLTMLAVCHTVVPEREHGKLSYQASSPDEGALVKAANDLGFVFTERTPEYVEIDVHGEVERYYILNVLEFTSQRKRMSTIVRTEDGRIFVLCKGADTVIYDRLGKDQEFKESTLQHLEEFASEGLRTLCFAFREVAQDEYDEWSATFYKASTALKDREAKLEEAAELIEMNFMLIGSSAIEDKLQEGVPETIATLLLADIRIWVLTGDKQETAINIGYASHLINQNMQLLIMNEDSLDQTRDRLRMLIDEYVDPSGIQNEVSLIVDGKTLIYALDFSLRKDFLELAICCKSVICCRVSPMQKSELVELVKQNVHAVTLAIGDGANDVSMIQAADVGIGISGNEGLQAANSSDYSIAQFRFLKKLMLVHGVWSYSRISKLILYSFYKNICLYIMEFWFAMMNGWSGQILFNRWCIAFYNVIFTVMPPFAIGLFDRNISAQSMQRFPQLYKPSQNAKYFNTKVFWMWTVNSIIHSLLIFWISIGALHQDAAFKSGYTGDYLFVGNMVYTYVVVVVSLKAGLEMEAWSWPVHFSLWHGFLSWLTFFAIYSACFPVFPSAGDMSGESHMVFSCSIFWMLLFLIPVAVLMRDVVWKAFCRTMFKTLAQEVQEAEIDHIDPTVIIKKSVSKRLNETSRLLGRLIKRKKPVGGGGAEEHEPTAHGYAFSQEEHGVITQSEVIRAYDTTKQPHNVVSS